MNDIFRGESRTSSSFDFNAVNFFRIGLPRLSMDARTSSILLLNESCFEFRRHLTVLLQYCFGWIDLVRHVSQGRMLLLTVYP